MGIAEALVFLMVLVPRLTGSQINIRTPTSTNKWKHLYPLGIGLFITRLIPHPKQVPVCKWQSLVPPPLFSLYPSLVVRNKLFTIHAKFPRPCLASHRCAVQNKGHNLTWACCNWLMELSFLDFSVPQVAKGRNGYMKWTHPLPLPLHLPTSPPSHKERGLATTEQFLGCAKSAKCH